MELVHACLFEFLWVEHANHPLVATICSLVDRGLRLCICDSRWLHTYPTQTITLQLQSIVSTYVYTMYYIHCALPYEHVQLLSHEMQTNFQFPSHSSLLTNELHSPFTLRLSSRWSTRGRLSLSSSDGKDRSVLVAFSVSLWSPVQYHSCGWMMGQWCAINDSCVMT